MKVSAPGALQAARYSGALQRRATAARYSAGEERRVLGKEFVCGASLSAR